MLIFGVYKRQRISLEVPVAMTVLELKKMVQAKLAMPADVIKRDNKVMVLSYAGGDLEDDWIFSDLGFLPGTTIKVQLKDNIQPVLYIRCSHNQDTISVFDNLTLTAWKLSLVRSLASTKSGLPVGIFRLTTSDHREMFDHHCLQDYGVDVGHTILLEAWDGWREFLNLSIMGFTPQVMAQLDVDEAVARYQLKVALFLAAHLGHIDLARCVLKQGVHSDEPTGYHPAKMWCKEQGHVDSLKCPVHEATLSGQVGVLRLFVNFDITCLKAKDGHGLEPLNLALREKVKNCASFLLSKQWAPVNITKTFALHLATFTKLRKWCERAKERALVKYGPGKSSLKKRSFNTGSLVNHGVVLDGFSKSPMTGRSKTEVLKEGKENQEKEMRRLRLAVPIGELLGSTIEPERYFRSVLAAQAARLRQRPGKPLRWQKSSTSSQVSKAASVAKEMGYKKASWQARSQLHVPNYESSKLRPPSILTADCDSLDDDVFRLPPIVQNTPFGSTVHSQSSWGRGDGKITNNTAALDKQKINQVESNGLTKSREYNSASALLNQPRSLTRSGEHLVKETTTNGKRSEVTLSDQINIFKKVSARNNLSDRRWLKLKSRTAPSEASASTDDVFLEEEISVTSKKRKKRYTTSAISARMNSIRSSVPLPLVNHESSPRPFYYHLGIREDELIEAALGLVAKYRGDSSHERAIKSLSLANAFTEMPWLSRVRLALNVTRRSLQRNLPALQEREVV